MAVFGVDFGNMNSVVSVARKGGIDIIVNEVSKRETSSIVSFGEKERYLGEKAADLTIRNWQNTVGSLKRLLGVKFDSEAARHEKKFLKTEIRPDANGFIEVKVNYKCEECWFKPEELIGMLFTNLRGQAETEAAIDAKVEPGSIKVLDCVVSCPVYFTALQRKLLHQGLQVAGLVPLCLLNETTSAALDWGIFKTGSLPEDEANSVVMAFVDLGQSATTCTVASFMKGQLKVIGHVYDRFLGVRDFDYLLFEHYSQEVKRQYKHDVTESKKNSLKLMGSLEKTKKVLSANQIALLACEMGDFDVNIPNISRESVEEMFAPLVEKLKELLQRALVFSGADRITAVEVIGGGSRIPCLKAAIAEVFQKPVQTTLNASESIAKGCGIMGAMLSPKFKVREFAVVDSNIFPVNIGYFSETTPTPIQDAHFPEINKRMAILKYGDAVPKTLNLTFDRIQEFELFVFYEENPDILTTCPDLLIGKYKIGAIPTVSVQPAPPVKVKLRINPSMMINVEGATVTEEWETEETVEEKVPKPAAAKPAEAAKDPSSPQAQAAPMETDDKAPPKDAQPEFEVIKKVIKKKNTKRHDCTVTPVKVVGHSAATVGEMREKEVQMMLSDVNVQRTMNAKNSVESYIYEMRNKVNPGGIYNDYISQKERAALTEALTAMESWLYDAGDDASRDEYVQKLNEMKKLGDPIVNRYNERRILPQAVLSLRGKCAEIVGLAKDAKHAHIPAEELQSVIQKAEEMSQWLQTEVTKNASTSLHQDPTFHAATVQAKQKELESFATPILSKPKPKEEPKKETPTAASPTSFTDAAAAAADTATASPENAGAAPTGPKPPVKDMDLD